MSPVISSIIAVENAWAVALESNYAYIADEDNILIYNVSNIASPFYLSEISTTNAVKDLIVSGNHLYSALGSDGVAIYDLSIPVDPQLLDSFNTNTMANRIAAFDGKVAVADWDDVDVIDWNGTSLEHV